MTRYDLPTKKWPPQGRHRPRKLRIWLRTIKLKRGSRCQLCGCVEGKRPQEYLHAHHVLRAKTWPQFIMEQNNIVIVCQKCHILLERISVAIDKMLRSNANSAT